MNKELLEIVKKEAEAQCTIGPLQFDGFHRGASFMHAHMQERMGKLITAMKYADSELDNLWAPKDTFIYIEKAKEILTKALAEFERSGNES